MNMHLHLKALLVVAAVLAMPLTQAATITKADYKAGKAHIDTDYKAGKAACATLAGNGKDVCIEQAKAKQKVERAELEYGYTGKAADQNKVRVAKAQSAYAVAKERCDDLAGNPKDVCVQEAKAAETRALADAKLGKEVGAARTDAAEEKRDADFKVELAKCDALAGDAKAACVSTAKASFGKS
jgi:hypothetical protein